MKRSAPEDQTPRGPSASLAQNSTKGLTGIQKFRILKRLHPNLEVHEVWSLAGYTTEERLREAANAPWADGRASPKEARYRRDPRED